jgi:beta-glucosidase
MVASVAQAPILLKAFKRIELKKGESKTISFNLTAKELSMYNAALEEVVEPGDFKVMIGAASNDIRLEGKFTL